MLSVALQDVNQNGDVIYRNAETENQALRQARKDYIRCDFMVIGVLDLSTNQIDFTETLEFQ